MVVVRQSIFFLFLHFFCIKNHPHQPKKAPANRCGESSTCFKPSHLKHLLSKIAVNERAVSHTPMVLIYYQIGKYAVLRYGLGILGIVKRSELLKNLVTKWGYGFVMGASCSILPAYRS